jgi:hypothetical protein
MPYLGTLTPEQAEKLGVPRSVSVISPAYGNRSKASTSSKSQPLSSGIATPESLPTSEASNSAPADPMQGAIDQIEAFHKAKHAQVMADRSTSTASQSQGSITPVPPETI